jgi:hypothetical protein
MSLTCNGKPQSRYAGNEYNAYILHKFLCISNNSFHFVGKGNTFACIKRSIYENCGDRYARHT